MSSIAVAISGSPSRDSKSRQLLAHALVRLAAAGARTRAIELADLPADALLGRAPSETVTEALAALREAHIVVVGTPVYRASYSGLLKVFFDLLEPEALTGKVAILIASGGGAGHQLVLDHALRPLVASVGAIAVPTAVYATDRQFLNGAPEEPVIARIDRAVAEAVSLSASAHPLLAGGR